MTSYRSARDMADVVRSAINIPGAVELLDALNSWTTELIPVNAAHPSELVSTYEIRLARSEDGEGPRTSGLPGLVQALRYAESDVGLFSVRSQSAHYIGLLDESGSVLLALVMILLPDVRQGG